MSRSSEYPKVGPLKERRKLLSGLIKHVGGRLPVYTISFLALNLMELHAHCT